MKLKKQEFATMQDQSINMMMTYLNFDNVLLLKNKCQKKMYAKCKVYLYAGE